VKHTQPASRAIGGVLRDRATACSDARRALLEYREPGGMRDLREQDLRPGEILAERFEIIESIGAGGMGTVYRAQQLSIDRTVAVKVMHSTSNLSAARFENEAKLAARLQHPNVLSVIDFGSDESGRLYFVTELLRGESLSERIARGPLDEKQVLPLLRAICDALKSAHEKNIVHRDLKPSNLFLDESGDLSKVKILDFGIAKLLDAPDLTASGELIGTPKYISPERARRDPAEPKSDIYSLGLVAYECLTQKSPFSAGSAEAMLAKHVLEAPRPFSRHFVSPGLEALIMEMLAKTPEARPDAAGVLSRLSRLERQRPPRKKSRVIAAAIAVLLLLAAGAFLLDRAEPKVVPVEPAAKIPAPAPAPAPEQKQPPKKPEERKTKVKIPEGGFEDFDTQEN
jgi:eukaryotic-like serine/threonine-protein kinase